MHMYIRFVELQLWININKFGVFWYLFLNYFNDLNFLYDSKKKYNSIMS